MAIDWKEKRQAIIDAIDVEEYLKKNNFKIDKLSGDVLTAFCLFHDDKNKANFNIFVAGPKRGRWQCFVPSCPAHNSNQLQSIFDLHARLHKASFQWAYNDLAKEYNVFLPNEKPLKFWVEGDPTAWAQECHRNLILDVPKRERLLEKKGITLETIRILKIGWDKEQKRYVFPIFNQEGQVIQARRYILGASKHIAKCLPALETEKGKGTFLYPTHKIKEINYINNDVVVICAGETDTISALQRGFNAVTHTGGEGSTWTEDWNYRLKDKKIYICYDIDPAGRKGARKLADKLLDFGFRPHIIALPIEAAKYPKGDLTDYFHGDKYTAKDFINLCISTPAYEKEQLEALRSEDTHLYDVEFEQAHKCQYHGRKIKFVARVVGRSTYSWVVPKRIIVSGCCPTRYCRNCEHLVVSEDEFYFEKESAALLGFIRIREVYKRKTLMRALGIPTICTSVQFHEEDSYNIWEISLQPEHNYGTVSTTNILRTAYYIGDNIEWNTTYEFEGMAVSDPATQQFVIFVHKAVPMEDMLASFKITPSIRETLEKSRLKRAGDLEVDLGLIRECLKGRYTDLECNVTRIFDRHDMHFAIDLWLYSVLAFKFQGRSEKGYIEVLIVGDTQQGKSEASRLMQEHYNAGRTIDAAKCSASGLIGGMEQRGGQYYTEWGILPAEHGKAIKIEEMKNFSEDTLELLRQVRTSGEATLAMVGQQGKQRALAWVRKLFLSNPRREKMIHYPYGVLGIKSLVRNTEDLARFTFCMAIDGRDIDAEIINRPTKDLPQHTHKYTGEICRTALFWVWSRTEEQIHIPEETEDEVIRWARLMAQEFPETDVPLVLKSNIRMHLVRMAAALAGLLISTDDQYEDIYIRPEHVVYVAMWLKKKYTERAMSYRAYCTRKKQEREVANSDQLKMWLKDRMRVALEAAKAGETAANLWQKVNDAQALENAAQNGSLLPLVNILLDMGRLTVGTFTNLFDLETVDERRRFVGKLMRANCLKETSHGYKKTEPFIGLLNDLKTEIEEEEADKEFDEF